MIEFIKDKKNIAAVAVVAIIVVSIILFVFSFASMSELRAKYSECKLIETKVFETRNMIESARQAQGERILPTEKNIAQGIHELKKHAKSKEIKFISITTKELKEDNDTGYKILPVEMKIESTHEQLAVFLGSLDDFNKGLVKVVSFDIVPDEAEPTKFLTDLTVHMYFSGKANAE